MYCLRRSHGYGGLRGTRQLDRGHGHEARAQHRVRARQSSNLGHAWWRRELLQYGLKSPNHERFTAKFTFTGDRTAVLQPAVRTRTVRICEEKETQIIFKEYAEVIILLFCSYKARLCPESAMMHTSS